MLSRVANRLYWMARYLERAEDTARLVDAHSHLILDIPKGLEPEWSLLIDTMDARTRFLERYKRMNERNVVKFLLADTNNSSSLAFAIDALRENVRTTRDVLPRQFWELVNEYSLFVKEQALQSVGRTRRFAFLEEAIARSQQLNGLILSTVMRDHVLRFIRLGSVIERADMTSRIVDVAMSSFVEKRRQELPEAPVLLANLLRALSATSGFRRTVGGMPTAAGVVDFVFNNGQLPRSIVFCTNAIEEILGELRGPRPMLQDVRRIHKRLREFDAEQSGVKELHELVESVQQSLALLDDAIYDHWFDATDTGARARGA